MSNALSQVYKQRRTLGNIAADCPHCGAKNATFVSRGIVHIGTFAASMSARSVEVGECKVCGEIVVGYTRNRVHEVVFIPNEGIELIYPTGVTWPDKAPANLDPEIKKDYDEARAVLHLSPQSAATLARRVLQHVLREKVKVKEDKLGKEVKQACESPLLGQPAKNALDHVRTIGNWGAHPLYDDANTLLRVEPGEAEYTLETIELLFHDLYDEPAKFERMDNALKLKEQGQAKPGRAE